MPITRVPITHKFGIISHSQRLELQERLLKQSYLQTVRSKPELSQARNPTEVTDEFINQYNSSRSFDEKERLDDLAHKMLERIKRRAGIRDGGRGGHVDLPIAWTELSQLAQCKGAIQEDCLDVLITSLDQAPLSKAHIPALFYLAETCLYWLRTDAVNQPYLRTGEIKLLKMGQLVFTRLFYHHMAGQLQGQNDFKSRLFTYLDGFSECQEAYNPYPNALLSLRYINEVGKIVIGDAVIEPGEVKEGDFQDKQSLIESLRSSSKGRDSSAKNSTSHYTAEDHFREVSANYEPTATQTSKSGALSSSVHDLSPTLWHALDVWRCTNSLGGGLEEAVYALSQCGKNLAQENWVDAMCALSVLSEAAKSNPFVLKAMQNLARGMVLQTPQTQTRSAPHRGQSTRYETITTGFTEEVLSARSDVSVASQTSLKSLSDIYEQTEEDTTSVKDSLSSERGLSGKSEKTGSRKSRELSVTSATQADIGLENYSGSLDGATRTDETVPSPDGVFVSRSKEVSFDVNVMEREATSKQSRQSEDLDKVDSAKSGGRVSAYEGLPGTGWKAEAGSDLPSGRVSEASSVPTFTNTPYPSIPGLHGWHWEVGITFTELMADIVLHGTTSNIQKRALVGNNTEYDNIHKRETHKHPMKSSGLLDLVHFKASQETDDNSPNDWSWRIRYTALQGLVKICRCCAGDQTKDGIRTVAWTALVRAHTIEKDDRVLEALKVGQVDANIENLLSRHLSVSQSTIGGKMASTLSKMYLPPLPPPVEPRSTTTTPHRMRPKPSSQPTGAKTTPKRQPMRTSLREEIMLATVNQEKPPDYNTRTGFDLKRIVEDQWRKDLQAQLELEEKERLKALELEQKALEEEARQREIRKAEKLKGRKPQVPATC